MGDGLSKGLRRLKKRFYAYSWQYDLRTEKGLNDFIFRILQDIELYENHLTEQIDNNNKRHKK